MATTASWRATNTARRPPNSSAAMSFGGGKRRTLQTPRSTPRSTRMPQTTPRSSQRYVDVLAVPSRVARRTPLLCRESGETGVFSARERDELERLRKLVKRQETELIHIRRENSMLRENALMQTMASHILVYLCRLHGTTSGLKRKCNWQEMKYGKW